MGRFKAPFYPVVYVRGYAMTRGEIDDTTADPFCGFNIGSTVLRATPDRGAPPRKFVFESPVVRLMTEYGYGDVYEDGCDILDPEWDTAASGEPTGNKVDARCIVIHRYYDEASRLLGQGRTPDIRVFAGELSRLVARLRELVCANPQNGVAPQDFRCYLVAHSMGGLVARAMLQNPALDPHGARAAVDKFFTYATPHNGIEMAGINVPAWLTPLDMNNFNRAEMADYLALGPIAAKNGGRVDLLPESLFPGSRVFCMVGTNRMDYEVAAGLSRTFVGHGSDGLVRVENATLCSVRDDGTVGDACAKAFAYRAHSGHYGIVNSEEAFQNLARFLFGDVRVDIWLDIADIVLPEAVRKAAGAARVDALYQVELLASPRGKLWSLTRRMAEEDSVACVTHADWAKTPSLYLSSVFLANWARVNPRRRSLAYAVTLGVRTPDYEIDRRLWINEHYEGGYLYRDTVIVELTPPRAAGDPWRVMHRWQSGGMGAADTPLEPQQLDGGVQIRLPVPPDAAQDAAARPGIRGDLRFVVSAWNKGAEFD